MSVNLEKSPIEPPHAVRLGKRRTATPVGSIPAARLIKGRHVRLSHVDAPSLAHPSYYFGTRRAA